ncbi:hypothetical protein Vadar_026936 [Vaccinium darrowii]|uniref:Uncharacterized protein n=1 Tax=Vaccinium darrowii TaxID=229202 RepID=A0ACB7X491_9ERIC|nr:hypothetical protein Vadar_026936 [Vaccinium darrowii]
MYSSTDVGRSKDYAGFHTATQWPRTDVLSTESPYQSSDMDRSSHDHPMIPNTLSGHVPFCDMLHKLPDFNPKTLMGSQNWRRPSPEPVILPYPLLHVKRTIGPMPSALDVIDVSQLQRKPMRSRIETILPFLGSPSPSNALDDRANLAIRTMITYGEVLLPRVEHPFVKLVVSLFFLYCR